MSFWVGRNEFKKNSSNERSPRNEIIDRNEVKSHEVYSSWTTRSYKSACKMTRNPLLSAGMNMAKCNLSNTKPHLFLLQINRKQMPIWYHMKHYPNRTEREQIHLHLCCVTFYLGFCCCHCCLCCLILLFDFHRFVSQFQSP